MSFDYATLFTDLGKIIGKANSYQTMAGTTLPTDRDAIGTELYPFLVVTEKLQPAYDQAQNGLVTLRQTLGYLHNLRLQDNTTVLAPLSLISPELTGIVRALWVQMAADSQTIKQCSVTLGTPTGAGTNAGNGFAFVSKVLDGVTQPGSGMMAVQQYNGVNSELCVTSETMILQCTSDSEVDGVPEGSEVFSLQGAANYPPLSWQAEGSGKGPSVTCFNRDDSYLNNKDFENWSSNTPASWTLTTGAAQVSKETTNFFRGSAALKFLGDGSTALNLNQSMSVSRFKARKRYFVAFAVKASAVPAAGDLLVQFTGTGYTAGSSEKVSVAHGSLTTAWVIYHFWINMPTVIPPDLALSVTCTAVESGKSIYLDSFVLTPAVFFGGLNLALVAGSSRWLRGDSITWTVANNNAGNFQTFFRRWLGAQLPSAGGGGETINDALAA